MWNMMRISRLYFITLIFVAAQTNGLDKLSEDSREVGIYIAGYAAKRLKELFGIRQ